MKNLEISAWFVVIITRNIIFSFVRLFVPRYRVIVKKQTNEKAKEG